jgi:hypothetical protein
MTRTSFQERVISTQPTSFNKLRAIEMQQLPLHVKVGENHPILAWRTPPQSELVLRSA